MPDTSETYSNTPELVDDPTQLDLQGAGGSTVDTSVTLFEVQREPWGTSFEMSMTPAPATPTMCVVTSQICGGEVRSPLLASKAASMRSRRSPDIQSARSGAAGRCEFPRRWSTSASFL